MRDNPLWQSVRAVRDGRVHLSPKLPFGWVDFPPGVNRLIGLWWLGQRVYPERFPEDLRVLKSVAGQIGGRTLCALGDFAINPVLSTVRHFPEEYEAKVKGNSPVNGNR